MPNVTFRNRRAASIENDHLRVTILQQGGHLAEVFDKQAGGSPLWIPPWPSIEPSSYDPATHPQYGSDAEAKLLAGIMGHNLCLDIFGPPSPEEAAAGLTVHGEASVATYHLTETRDSLTAQAHLERAQLNFERKIALRGRTLHIHEIVENLAPWDRPIAWTQHVTLGPPFLAKASTQLQASVTRSKVFEQRLGPDMHLRQAAEFDWPLAPLASGGFFDLRSMSNAPASTEYTAHLTDPQQPHASFVAFSPAFRLAFAYVWRRVDFPWQGIWREDAIRTTPPSNAETLTLGLEFGVSPMPEPRRAQLDRHQLFDTPTYRWLIAGGKLTADYWVISQTAESMPPLPGWPY